MTDSKRLSVGNSLTDPAYGISHLEGRGVYGSFEGEKGQSKLQSDMMSERMSV